MNGPFNTRISKFFGMRLPIVVGCIQNLSTADFVSAVVALAMGADGIIMGTRFLVA